MKISTRVKIGLKGKLMKTSNKVGALAFIYANAGHQKDVTRNRENLFSRRSHMVAYLHRKSFIADNSDNSTLTGRIYSGRY